MFCKLSVRLIFSNIYIYCQLLILVVVKKRFLLELLNVIFDFRKPYFKLLLVSCNVKPSVLQQIKEVKRPRNNQYLYNTILNTEFCATYSLNDEINFHKETRTAIEQAVDKFLLK